MRVSVVGSWPCLCFTAALTFSVFFEGRCAAAPIDFTFTRIADLQTPVPQGSGNFTALFDTDFTFGPSLAGGVTAFAGQGSSGQRGIYVNTGGLLRSIANTDTAVPIPGVAANFTFFDQPSTDGSRVSFVGAYGADAPAPFVAVPLTAVLVATLPSGSLSVVANQMTPIPGGTGNFTGFFASSQSGPLTTFKGFGESGQVGLYAGNGGAVVRIVDPTVPVPIKNNPSNTTSLVEYTAAAVAGSSVVFCGVNAAGNKGLYVDDLSTGTIRVMADTTTPIPGGVGNFIDFALREGIDDQGEIDFVGFGLGGQEGVYSFVNGSLSVIANQTMALPGGTGTFEHFNSISGVSVSAGAFVFMAAGQDNQGGIYMATGDSIFPVIKNGDIIDGKLVQLIQTNPPIPDWWNFISPLSIYTEGTDNRSVAFIASFTDGSTGVYLAAPVPEASTGLMFAIVSVGVSLYLFRPQRRGSGLRRLGVSRQLWPRY